MTDKIMLIITNLKKLRYHLTTRYNLRMTFLILWISAFFELLLSQVLLEYLLLNVETLLIASITFTILAFLFWFSTGVNGRTPIKRAYLHNIFVISILYFLLRIFNYFFPNTIESFRYFDVFFLSLAIICLIFSFNFMRNHFTRTANFCSSFSFKRQSFISNPVYELEKFAFIRILFGGLLLERSIKIAIYIPSGDWFQQSYTLFVAISIIMATLLMIGFLTQVTLVVLTLFEWQIFESITSTGTLGNDIAAILAMLLLFTNSGSRFSIDQKILDSHHRIPISNFLFYYGDGPSTYTIQLSKLIALFSYWAICIYSLSVHINEDAWMTGVAGPLLLTNNFTSRFHEEFTLIFGLGWPMVEIGRVSLWAMLPWYALLFPFIVFGGILKNYAIIWGLAFFTLSLFFLHLGWLGEFEFLLWAALFWNYSFIYKKNDIEVAFDDRCNLCDRTIYIIKFLDIFQRVKLRPASKNLSWLQEKGINEIEAMKDLHAILPYEDNRIEKGYDFYLLLSSKILLILPFYPILLLGKFLRVGPMIYRFVADRRTKLFGVCALPTKKYNQMTITENVPDLKIKTTDPIVLFFTHVLFLFFFFLVTIPMPGMGWNGLRGMGDAIDVGLKELGKAARIYGITPIDVFNSNDLRLAENWFTVHKINDDGTPQLLEIFDTNGSKLALPLSSDRLNFGTALAFRRMSIGQKGCLLEVQPFRSFIDRLILASGPIEARSKLTYKQYHQPLTNDEIILGGSFAKPQIITVCQRDFEFQKPKPNPR